jgi:hypothetical protein
MLEISKGYLREGFEFLNCLRDQSILHEFNHSRRSILVTCGDMDRIEDILLHLRKMAKFQLISLNGGAILLGRGYFQRNDIILEDILDASRIKGLNFIQTLGHFPCGKAAQRGHTAKDISLMVLEGEERLRETLSARIDGLQILPLMHVDWRGSPWAERGLKTYAMRYTHYDAIREMPYT